jgi:hypothetical protein
MFRAVLVATICLVAGFAEGYKTALAREHSRLERNKQIISPLLSLILGQFA